MRNSIATVTDQFGAKAFLRAQHEMQAIDEADIVLSIAAYDPTPTKKYLSWLVRKYGDGGIQRYEDFPRAELLLKKYEALKNKSRCRDKAKNVLTYVEKDINRIKTIGDLQDLVETHADKSMISRREERKDEEVDFYRTGQAVLFHDDDEVKVVIPKTEEASCYFGRNTRWCTAATETRNYFDHYPENLYIVLIKATNTRYQFYFSSKPEQFADEKDQPINPRRVADRYPVLWTIFRQPCLDGGSFFLVREPSEEEQLRVVRRAGMAIHAIEHPSEAVQLAAVTQNYRAVGHIAQPSEAVQLVAVKQNRSGRLSFLHFLGSDPFPISLIRNPSEAVRLAAVRTDGLTIQYIDNPSETVKLAAVLQNCMAIQFIDHPSKLIERAASINMGGVLRKAEAEHRRQTVRD